MKRLLVSVTLIMLCAAATAQTRYSSFGGFDCGNWLNDASMRPWARMWLAGFMSGINGAQHSWGKSGPDPLDPVSLDQVTLWMDKWCREHPLEKVATGGLQLFDELNDRVTTKK